MRARAKVAAVAALAAFGAACAGGADGGRTAGTGRSSGDAAREAKGGWIGEDDDIAWSSASERGAAGAAYAEEGVEGGDYDRSLEPAATGDGTSSEPAPTIDAAPADTSLNAGSVDDNEQWGDYLLYREDFATKGIEVHDVDVRGRQVVRVVDGEGRPVLGAAVKVVDESGATVAQRTSYADGRVMFFTEPSTGQDPSPALHVEVTKGDAKAEQGLDRESLEHSVTLDAPGAADPVPLDVLFLVDATGSMSDEIEQLKANMVSVAEQIDKLSPRPDVHFAMTVYRDRGDLFVTRTFDFTADVAQFTSALRDVVAEGGGDTPESLNEALHAALAEPAWRGGDAVKLVFLVADAAPHLDYEDDADYANDVMLAAERGVKIHPVASSGMDDQGEYVFRQLAQLTTGRFNFLTYGADGRSPGDSTPHHVDDYSVLSLDALVVQLVRDELSALAG